MRGWWHSGNLRRTLDCRIRGWQALCRPEHDVVGGNIRPVSKPYRTSPMPRILDVSIAGVPLDNRLHHFCLAFLTRSFDAGAQ
jgi:hypothetical protein